MRKLLVLDVGEKRTGYAIGYHHISVPQETGVITNTERISELVKECDIVVVGLPISLGGRFGDAVVRTLEWVSKHLSMYENVEIYLVDERLTSSQSEKILLESGMKRKRRRVVSNAVSAFLLYDVFVRGSPRRWKFKRNFELDEVQLDTLKPEWSKILIWNVPIVLKNVPEERCIYFTDDPQIAWKLRKTGYSVYNLVEDIRKIEPFDVMIVEENRDIFPSMKVEEVYTLHGGSHKDKRSKGS
ncbi:MAG: Holliday junction resolvase RuvX [Thermotogae bacterium]|nr:Holliday junction resolvase RuvX [Thermotogota bacterium]